MHLQFSNIRRLFPYTFKKLTDFRDGNYSRATLEVIPLPYPKYMPQCVK